MAALAIAFYKCDAPRWSGLGENYIDLEMSHTLLDVGLPVFCALQEALADTPFDIEFVCVASALDLPSRDEDVCLVTRAVLVDWLAGGAAVADEDLAISPGLVVVRNDVVLQIAHFFPLLEGSSLTPAVMQSEGGLVFENLVHAFVETGPERLANYLPELFQHAQSRQLGEQCD